MCNGQDYIAAVLIRALISATECGAEEITIDILLDSLNCPSTSPDAAIAVSLVSVPRELIPLSLDAAIALSPYLDIRQPLDMNLVRQALIRAKCRMV